MERFTFRSSLVEQPLLIQQEVAGIIGCKVYPGALVLVGHFEAHPPPPSTRVLELGSGVCGLPSLVLAGAGCAVVATDVPSLVSGGLARNLELNASSATCLPLTWGDDGEAAALRASLIARGSFRGHSPPCCLPSSALPCSSGMSVVGLVDVIVAADVVYHEPLIEPLLKALVALTEPPQVAPESEGDGAGGAASASSRCSCTPPRIVMSYVQVCGGPDGV